MKNPSGILDPKEIALQERETRDPLTRLPNRIFFEDRVFQAIHYYRHRKQPFAVLSLELDGFPEIVERHGRFVADRVLKVVAVAMKMTLRRGDMLARLRGEQFAATIPDVATPQEILPAIQRLMDAAIEPVQVGELCVQVSVSIGVSFYPQIPDLDAFGLIEQAEQAMAEAQSAGRNLYHFCESAGSNAHEQLDQRIDRIRQALVDQEFALFYQPKVNLSEGDAYGVEALIRWRHPERGLLTPSEFLPLIEEHRLAIEIGAWVIKTALAQLAEWDAQGLRISVSVNIGPRHFLQPDFATRLGEMLARHPVGFASRLELEIHGGLEDASALATAIRACQALGVSIALDHFGTGNSSLADLKLLPVQVLKIDSIFVRDLLENPADVAILESILGLAEALGRQCVAEGVETVEQGLLLLRLGCEKAQGYGIAVPMEASALPEWIAGWSPDPSWLEANMIGVEERLLVYTGVEHNSWIAALEAYLKGERETEPHLGRHQCQLGYFIDGEEQAGRNSHPSFQALAALHWRIHAMSAGIVKLHNQNKSEEGLARLADLQVLLGKLLEQLKNFRMKI